MTSSPAAVGTARWRPPSRRRRSASGRGWCRWAATAPASTASTASTTAADRAPTASTPQWQNLREGDRIASAPDASRWFDVALLVPERALVLRASVTVPAARNFDPADGLPRAYSDSTWGFFLRPTVDGHTRLVVTGKARGKPHAPIAVANWLFWDPAHWVMQLKQFAGLRRRAESVPKCPTPPAMRAPACR